MESSLFPSGSSPFLAVLYVEPEKMVQNIPADAALYSETGSKNLAIDVLNRMYKGNGEFIWKHAKKRLKEKGIKLICRSSSDPSADSRIGMAIVIDSCSKVPLLSCPKMLLQYESPLMDPNAYRTTYQECFNTILTFTKPRTKKAKFVSYSYPVKRPTASGGDSIPFSERGLCCLVATEKSSAGKEGALSIRSTVVKYFEENDFEALDVYGRGWEEFPRVKKGVPGSKDAEICKYKFNLCPENTTNLKGYVTEKSLDAFALGVVPVWAGPPDASRFIPDGCYVDLGKFAGHPEALHRFLSEMTEEEWNGYRTRIREFMNSPLSYRFTPEAFVSRFVEAVLATVNLNN